MTVESTGTVKADVPTSRADIVGEMRKQFPGLAIRGRATWRRKNASGWFDKANDLIRTNDPYALDVVSHELGHYIDKLTSAMKMDVPSEVSNELTAMGNALYGGKTPVGGFKSEGWAEFVRGWLTCSEEMADVCPNTLTWFNTDWTTLNHEIAQKLMKIQDAVSRLRLQRPEDAVKAFWKHKNPLALPSGVMRIASKVNYYELVDDLHFLLSAQREAGIDVDVNDPKLSKSQRAEAIKNDPFLKATLYRKAAGRKTVEMALRGTSNLVGNERTGESLYEALDGVRGDDVKMEDWKTYAVARRAQEYHKRGFPSGLTKSEADATVTKLQSKAFDDTIERVTAWSRRVLHLLVENGALTQEEFDTIEEMNPIYIKFMRRFEEDQINKRKAGAGKAVNRIKGGTQTIEDPISAMLVDAQKIIQAAQQSDITRCIVTAAGRAKTGTNVADNWIVEVPAPKKATTFSSEKIKLDVAKIAVDRFGVSPIDAAMALSDKWTDKLTVFQDATSFNGKEKDR